MTKSAADWDTVEAHERAAYLAHLKRAGFTDSDLLAATRIVRTALTNGWTNPATDPVRFAAAVLGGVAQQRILVERKNLEGER